MVCDSTQRMIPMNAQSVLQELARLNWGELEKLLRQSEYFAPKLEKARASSKEAAMRFIGRELGELEAMLDSGKEEDVLLLRTCGELLRDEQSKRVILDRLDHNDRQFFIKLAQRLQAPELDGLTVFLICGWSKPYPTGHPVAIPPLCILTDEQIIAFAKIFNNLQVTRDALKKQRQRLKLVSVRLPSRRLQRAMSNQDGDKSRP